jgi:hypothetical protein
MVSELEKYETSHRIINSKKKKGQGNKMGLETEAFIY